MSPLQQRAMEPTKAAFGKAFWDQEAESAAALDGHVRVHQSHAPPFSLTMPSGLARSQQLYMMQRFLNIPATPSYVKTEGGMVLDRVVANLGGRTWWNTFTLRLRAQRAWNSQQFTEGRPQRILGDPSLYALGGRFRAGFSRHTVLKAFGELGSLKGLLGRFGSLRGADPNASNPNVTNTPTGITPSLSDELGDEIPRGRVTLRSTAVPYHVFTADWSHRERFQTHEGYEAGPSHVTASLASRGPQHVNYRVGVRQWLDDTIPAFELAPGGGRRAPPRRELVTGASAEKQLTVWRGDVRPPPEGKRPGGYAALPVKPCITVGGILGALCRIPVGPNAGPGWKSGEAEWRQVCSGAMHASFGSFQRPMFDYTSVDLRYDAGAIAPRRPLAERPASELTVVERALESSGVRVESETVTLSATQQILGPLRGRFEVRCHPKALAGAVREGWRSFKTPKKESDGEGGEVYSGRFGSAWHSVRGEMAAAEVIYGVDCPLPPALGAARLVAWYNVTRAEAMAEMRLFDL